MERREIKVGLVSFDNIKLHRADCMEIMSDYPDNYFDLAVVDPPYGIGASAGVGSTRGKPSHYAPKDWDNEKPTSQYWETVFRVSVNQVVWGGNYFTNHLPPSRCWLYWQKLMGGNYSDGELAWTSFDQALKEFTQRSDQGGRFHPTQKPVKLYSWIYANYAKPGQRILDTHLGSGSNAIAAHYAKMGEFVGCELDEDYFEAACERVYKETRQQELF